MQRNGQMNRESGGTAALGVEEPRKYFERGGTQKTRVFIAAENRLLQEALARMLAKRGDIDVIVARGAGPFRAEELASTKAKILLLASRGKLSEDLILIRNVRTMTPCARILLLGMTRDETDFLQSVRAGVSGYLLRDASAEEVLTAVRTLQQGEVYCPNVLCAVLFRYFEREATSFPSARVQEILGLTRREQQLIPLISQGMTNKEMANHFCLSEQTIKNHLYRMKHKIGAENRLGIVEVCRTQGFLA
ncbi:MAG: two-component system response regulator LnrK [Candidatus Acidiferrum sp.]